MTDIYFVGDPHGDFRRIHEEARNKSPDAIVLLGDMDLERPIHEEFAAEIDVGVRVLWIAGNHDGDREEWYERLFHPDDRVTENLHARVIDVGGVRIAGLAGVFRGKVWFPGPGGGEPKFKTREHFLASIPPHHRWRGGLPRNHLCSIWPEDYEHLADLKADILVTHEAPSCHEHGFDALDLLAEAMGAKMIVHGHHHVDYKDVVSGDIEVFGVARAAVHHVCMA